MNSKTFLNITVRFIGGIGLILLFAGLLSHWLGSIGDNSDQINFLAGILTFVDDGNVMPGFVETGYSIMKVDIDSTNLGLMISGLSIYFVSFVGLFFVNYPMLYFVNYLGLCTSTFLMCFMYFVTKLSVDGMNNWDYSTAKLAIWFPMGIMFACFLAASVCILTISDFAGDSTTLNVFGKGCIILAMMFGCLFYPLGIYGFMEYGNYGLGIGMIGSALIFGLIAGIFIRIGRVYYYTPKPIVS